MQKRRVVVTGVGLVTALGTGTEETWNGLCEAQSGITKITRFDTTQFSTKIAGEVKNFDPLRWFEKKDVKKMDSFIHYAVAAAEGAKAAVAINKALQAHAGLVPESASNEPAAHVEDEREAEGQPTPTR